MWQLASIGQNHGQAVDSHLADSCNVLPSLAVLNNCLQLHGILCRLLAGKTYGYNTWVSGWDLWDRAFIWASWTSANSRKEEAMNLLPWALSKIPELVSGDFNIAAGPWHLTGPMTVYTCEVSVNGPCPSVAVTSHHQSLFESNSTLRWALG